MKRLDEIESGVQFSGRKGDESITSGTGLDVFNRIYRAMALNFPWPELRQTHTLPDTTTAGTGTYDWFRDVTFLDVRSLEIQDGDDLDRYKIVIAAPDDISWGKAGRKSRQSVPDFHLLHRSATDEKTLLELRPAPKYGSKNIRATGIIEPPPLKDQAQTTIFRNRTADDALELLVAAEFLATDGSPFAQTRIEQARQLLAVIFGREPAPSEMPVRSP